MRVALFPADSGPCSWYRLRFVAQALADDPNVDVSVRDILRFRASEGPDFDVGVFQRPFSAELYPFLPMLQERWGVAVVVDMDDDCSNLPPGHSAFAQLHPKWNPAENWVNAERACAVADLVTVSTPPLLNRYASHGRGVVLRNCVPEEYLGIKTGMKSPGESLVVGWTGTLSVHPGDLEVCRAGIARGIGDARFRAVEAEALSPWPADEVHRRLGIGESQRDLRGRFDVREGFPEFVASLDVGIAPLSENGFNRAKSGLRGLEYAALGVPFIASPLPEYRKLAEMGVGLLAAKPKDWERHLRALLGSVDRRLEQRMNGRAVVAELTYERQAHHWAEAWERALAIRRSSVAV